MGESRESSLGGNAINHPADQTAVQSTASAVAGADDPALLARLASMERRLEALEIAIGRLVPAGSADPQAYVTPELGEPDAVDVSGAEEPGSTRSPADSPGSESSLASQLVKSFTPPTAPPTAPPAAPPIAPPHTLPARRPGLHVRAPSERDSARDGAELERLIGGRWYALGGALVVIVGIALFVRFAWQQGWVKEIPGGVRCLIAALLGVGLLGVAEWARRRVNAWAAVGLNAAGLGTIYVAAYSAYALYDLFSPELAGLLLVGCVALGVVIGVRGRLVPVAAVALLGGYLTPFLVSTDSDRLWVLPPYWLMLLATGLLLAAWRGEWFIALRWLTWSLTLVLGAVWIVAVGPDHSLLGVVFLGLTWAMAHAELWWSCARSGDEATGSSLAAPDAGPAPTELGWSTWAPMLSSFVVSFWAVGLGVHLASWSGDFPRWLPAAAGAGAALLVAFPMIGHLRVLRDPAESASERLGAALWLQAAACTIAAIALGVSGWSQMIAWVAMGTAAIAAGRWAAARPVVGFGVIVLLIAVVRLLTWEMVFSGARAGGVELLWLRWTPWSAMGALTIAALGAAAWMLVRDWSHSGVDAFDSVPVNEAAEQLRSQVRRAQRGPQWQPVAVALTGLAVFLSVLVLGHEESHGLAILLAWALLAAGLGSLHRFVAPLRPLFLDFLALAVIGVTVVGWLAYFVGFGWERFDDPACLHRGLLLAALLAVEIAWLVGLTRPLWTGPSRGGVGIGLPIGILFIASSFEVARVAGRIAEESTVRGAAVSVWWGVVAVGFLIIGFRRRRAVARRIGLALLGAATLKALIIDTASVSTGWRAVTLVGLGLLMLGVGVVYSRLSKRET